MGHLLPLPASCSAPQGFPSLKSLLEPYAIFHQGSNLHDGSISSTVNQKRTVDSNEPCFPNVQLGRANM